MERGNETYKNPEEYLPQTFGITIHFITQEDGVDVYEFDFLDLKGESVWNCISKHKDYHDLMRAVIDIKNKCENEIVILYLPESK